MCSIGDLAAIGRLLEEHRPKLVSMVERRIDRKLAVRIDATDVLNEAFLVARRKYASFDQSSMSTYGWLYRITLDCLIEAWRRETRDRRDLAKDLPWPAESSAQLGMGLMDSGTSPSEAVTRKQLQERMQQTLDLLDPKDREVLWMRYYDQLTHKQAGEILGVAEGAATLRYVRALKRLTSLWHKLHGEGE